MISLVLLAAALAALALAWRYAKPTGRCACDPDKETPPAGWAIAHPAAWPVDAHPACPCAACVERLRPAQPARRATIRPESLWGA